jgi:hypothetical protein
VNWLGGQGTSFRIARASGRLGDVDGPFYLAPTICGSHGRRAAGSQVDVFQMGAREWAGLWNLASEGPEL